MAHGTIPLFKEKGKKQMIGVAIVLLVVAVASLFFKDYLLAGAAVLLLILSLVDWKPALDLLQKYTFPTGIFFLMIFILLPVATKKVKLDQSLSFYLDWKVIVAIVAGILISYLGGVGVKAMPQYPQVLLGVIIGTLIATLFMNGLPAGLIIAAGVVGILIKFLP